MRSGVLVEDLSRSFDGVRAVDGLSFAVPAGSVGAVLGPNGAGKTTTIRILTTLDTADAGRAFVGGYDVARQAHSVRSIIALTGQYAAVDGDLTGRQNLIMIGRLFHLSRRAAKARADDLLDRFRLAPAASRLTRSYSGGMRRRLDLAASLVTAPSVLFLDEPTTGLDPTSREELWAVVRSLRADGATILLTTQYLEEADRLADNVTVIDHGQAVANGTPAALKAAFGGDVLELVSGNADTADSAARFLTEKAGVPDAAIGRAGDRVAVTVPAGTYTVVEATRLLDAEGLWLEDIHLRRASLDEVFTALTDQGGRSAR
ncbi:MAG: type transport system ATP-binding protein [Pseudonocardiales bacterium]|jgi:daunorubicin resistance ABC transporter ATP-binding subunit|nr:type transport system ATP-binding protein [Pseudonocardiales bacterium]